MNRLGARRRAKTLSRYELARLDQSSANELKIAARQIHAERKANDNWVVKTYIPPAPANPTPVFIIPHKPIVAKPVLVEELITDFEEKNGHMPTHQDIVKISRDPHNAYLIQQVLLPTFPAYLGTLMPDMQNILSQVKKSTIRDRHKEALENLADFHTLTGMGKKRSKRPPNGRI